MRIQVANQGESMNILIVEDEIMIQEGVSEFLREQGYEVYCASDGLEGIEKFRQNHIQLVILDIMLPKMNGIEVLREIRRTSEVPILMLTAMGDEGTQVQSFDELADDYICKPFSLIILKKRIDALLRRHYHVHSIWKYGDAIVDFTGYHATYNGADAQVKPKEVMVLALLLEHRGQVLSREQILNHIWGEKEAPYDRVVDVYVKNLRKKLHLDCIVTVKNVGYKIEL